MKFEHRAAFIFGAVVRTFAPTKTLVSQKKRRYAIIKGVKKVPLRFNSQFNQTGGSSFEGKKVTSCVKGW